MEPVDQIDAPVRVARGHAGPILCRADPLLGAHASLAAVLFGVIALRALRPVPGLFQAHEPFPALLVELAQIACPRLATEEAGGAEEERERTGDEGAKDERSAHVRRILARPAHPRNPEARA